MKLPFQNSFQIYATPIIKQMRVKKTSENNRSFLVLKRVKKTDQYLMHTCIPEHVSQLLVE